MTKQEVIGLYKALNQLGNLKGVKFSYGVAKNLAIIKPEIESLEKASTPTEEYMNFEKVRISMVEQFAKKDEKGVAVQENNVYIIEDGKQEEMESAFEALKSEHKEVFDGRQKQIEEYSELLNSESTISLYKVNLADIPADISVQQMNSIMPIVDDSIPSPFNK